MLIGSMLYIFAHFLHMGLTVSPAGSYPEALSEDEERRYFTLARNGDEGAREKLIVHNLRLVSHIIRKYYSSSEEKEDLTSIGTIGLIKAVDSFDRDNGARFATYAARCIQNEILMYFRKEKKQSVLVSLNETIDIDKDGNPLTYSDVLGVEERMDEEVDRSIMCERLRYAIEDVLGERERRVIILRYGLMGEGPLSQKEVAVLMGISRSYISRIEKTAIGKLRNALGIRL